MRELKKMRSKGGQLSVRFSTYAKSRLSALQTTTKRKIQRDAKEIAVLRGCEAHSLQRQTGTVVNWRLRET